MCSTCMGFCVLLALPLQAELKAQEMLVQSLGLEDPLQKEMATHSSVLGWRIPRMEEPGRLASTVLPCFQRSCCRFFSFTNLSDRLPSPEGRNTMALKLGSMQCARPCKCYWRVSAPSSLMPAPVHSGTWPSLMLITVQRHNDQALSS